MNLPPLPKPHRVNQALYAEHEDLYTADQVRQAQREAVAAAVPDAPTDAAVWAMARKMADIFDYPWGSMPLSGRERMFQNVKAMLAAATEVKP